MNTFDVIFKLNLETIMKRNLKYSFYKGYTLVEILVVVAIIAILLSIGAAGVKNLTKNKGVQNGVPIIKTKFGEARALAIGQAMDVRLVVHADSALARNASSSELTQMHRDRYLRYVAVAQYVDANTDEVVRTRNASGQLTGGVWKVLERGTKLPENCFFDTKLSQKDRTGASNYVNHTATSTNDSGTLLADGMVEVTLPGDTTAVKCYFFEMNSLGIPVNPRTVLRTGSPDKVAPRVILSNGRLRVKSGTEIEYRLTPSERNYAGFVLTRNGAMIDYTILDNIVK